MPIKAAKVALGWMAAPLTNDYMTPTYSASANYISMGGAGFIYPACRPGGSKYGQSDIIRTEIDLDEQGKGTVRFFVNGAPAGEADWKLGAAYPAFSCEHGEVVCEVSRCDA
eukprot:CAMPEP_0119116260 /NCGR_PEP_ID=MMETSP1180-20130426/52186_1 /TAXON_ID=3052 ORGANISM="Chlamydomonas cf sp, Strain CCMP681" /NCGR_SAMPLE_ID=MMETSP1180 /ASSEMBLY_ACC=CAM_ASM_000741 /LENGTH=111 /DNA_ID=CAMNT_0007105387 /DNA_START=97 /DNA_END=432 /DNA_ORIENTATION=-